MHRMTTEPDLKRKPGRPPTVRHLDPRKAARIRLLANRVDSADVQAKQRRRDFRRYLATLRAEGDDVVALAEAAGLSRQTIYKITDDPTLD